MICPRPDLAQLFGMPLPIGHPWAAQAHARCASRLFWACVARSHLVTEDGCTLCGYCLAGRRKPLRVTTRIERVTCAKCLKRSLPFRDQREAGAMSLWRLVGATMTTMPPDYWRAYFVEVADETVRDALLTGEVDVSGIT